MNKKDYQKLNNKLITRLPDCDLQEIENFLKAQRQEIIEIGDKMKKTDKQTSARVLNADHYIWGYNKAIKDYQDKIKTLTKP